MGFEFNGMRLHELYFGNLGGADKHDDYKKLVDKLDAYFGSYAQWEKDFKATGMMRGIGWVILYQDNTNGSIFNQWINEHETGHLAGCTPVLIMDVFEHAFMTDYGLKRVDYINSFLRNINWGIVEKRLK
jgi:Fe-Mn family superoxide dismutase